MNAKTAARLAGALFLTATVTGALGAVALEADRTTPGAMLILAMTAAVAMIPPALFPILRRDNEGAAVGYVAARVLEAVLLLPAALGPLMVRSTGSAAVKAISDKYDEWGHPPSQVFFVLGAALLNLLLFRHRLAPRWLSGWALVALVPYLIDAFDPTSPVHAVLLIPMANQELALAVWLLVKGLRTPDAERAPAPAEALT